MSNRKLIEVLKKKADEEIEQLKKGYELQIEQLRKDYEIKRKDLESKFNHEKEKIRNGIKKRMEKSFQKEKLKNDLEIEHFISQRCREYAEKLAEELWNKSAESFFEKYVVEFDKKSWETIYVSNSDKELAKKYFNRLKVIGSEKITGGFIAENKERTFLVDNTLKSRFEKIWHEALPEIMRKVYERLDDKI